MPERFLHRGNDPMRPLADAVWAAADAVETAQQAVDGVEDRDVADSAGKALAAASFSLSEALRRLGRGERR